ncbi:hypothetical protein OHC33_009291 [Knufia fluminis]|uniref:Uncharacterized protein n=1 Tax=Knufia fluminis TaxID=191047 RepID=A0AAN8E9E4_9EURO|nr:hypothetical protein OHC33_009291 [Knufia fluminis]
MAFEETPNKRPKLDSGYATSPEPSPMKFPSAGQANNAVVLYDPVPMRKDPASMQELLQSPPITLTIGPEQSQTTVQASLFRGISHPLHSLLSSVAAGQTDAATINEYLRHDDKDAFLQLVSMAYGIVLKGEHINHAALPTKSESSSKAVVKSKNGSTVSEKSLVKCNGCKTPMFLSLQCETSKCDEPAALGLQTFFELQLAQSHGSISKQATGLKALQSSTTNLDLKDKTTGKSYPLMHFAKVFHLAGKYEVLSLQASALKAFERRLKKYSSLVQKDIDELLDVLRYLASASANGWVSRHSSEGDETTASTTDTSALLKSLMRYVVVHVEDLLDEDEFQEIVAEHGMIGLELMKVLKESIIASRGS